MDPKVLDLYSDYLLSSFGQTTTTGLAKLMAYDGFPEKRSGEK